ncbi:phosphoglycerate mutase-like protein [Delitschia confertaspora ATCC 74209]|uniref:Phosphoglycerate mutase-like protein n=1 Tax=Delitschia confertaspora ATCC 74209 TaxID=1513339 RepID=A0A9P4JGR6_9PLEO|nr:phosphoglycerate mutase-like protein [Delitschia confertaspora ATCC 74209]
MVRVLALRSVPNLWRNEDSHPRVPWLHNILTYNCSVHLKFLRLFIMPPTLLLIRHAQALHNVSNDWTIHDPPLSELGRQQCAELQQSLKASKIADEVDLIVVSSMRRTLETAVLGLDWLINDKKIKVLPNAGWQENADKPCDTGSAISVMEKEFPQLDFSQVDPRYPDKTTDIDNNPYAYTKQAIMARGQMVLKELYSRPEKVIAVVSHSGFLRTAVCNRRFFNADWRVFDYDEDAMRQSRQKGEGADSTGRFILKEWKETEEKGGGMGRSEKGIFTNFSADFPPDPPKIPETGEVTEENPVPGAN